jgi:hypothetical protein
MCRQLRVLLAELSYADFDRKLRTSQLNSYIFLFVRRPTVKVQTGVVRFEFQVAQLELLFVTTGIVKICKQFSNVKCLCAGHGSRAV